MDKLCAQGGPACPALPLSLTSASSALLPLLQTPRCLARTARQQRELPSVCMSVCVCVCIPVSMRVYGGSCVSAYMLCVYVGTRTCTCGLVSECACSQVQYLHSGWPLLRVPEPQTLPRGHASHPQLYIPGTLHSPALTFHLSPSCHWCWGGRSCNWSREKRSPELASPHGRCQVQVWHRCDRRLCHTPC